MSTRCRQWWTRATRSQSDVSSCFSLWISSAPSHPQEKYPPNQLDTERPSKDMIIIYIYTTNFFFLLFTDAALALDRTLSGARWAIICHHWVQYYCNVVMIVAAISFHCLKANEINFGAQNIFCCTELKSCHTKSCYTSSTFLSLKRRAKCCNLGYYSCL